MKYIHEDDTKIREWVSGNVLTKADKIIFTEERFERYDIEYWMKDKKHLLEVKNRHFNHDKYLTTFIELDKYEYMIDNSVELCILFDDGILYYTVDDIKKYWLGFKRHFAPDQYDAENNKWDEHLKQFAEFDIKENRFYPYSQFESIPDRKIIKSIYND